MTPEKNAALRIARALVTRTPDRGLNVKREIIMNRTVVKMFWAVPGVMLLTLALTAERPDARVLQQQPTVYRVDISVDTESGEISYSLDPVRAQPGDHVEWNCEQGAWSVHFIDKTPFAQKKLRGRGPKRLPIRSDAEDGSYKYFVAVAVGDDVFTDDPEVIVGPRG